MVFGALHPVDVTQTVPDVGKVKLVAPLVTKVKLLPPKLTAMPSVPDKETELLAVNVLPEAMVNVPVVEVMFNPLTVLLVRAWLAANPTSVSEVLGKVNAVLSVPLNEIVLLTVNVLPDATVKPSTVWALLAGKA